MRRRTGGGRQHRLYDGEKKKKQKKREKCQNEFALFEKVSRRSAIREREKEPVILYKRKGEKKKGKKQVIWRLPRPPNDDDDG